MHRDHEDANIWMICPYLPGCLDTIHDRHGNVHHHHIRGTGSRLFHSFLPVGCDGHHGYVTRTLQQEPKNVTNKKLIVCNENIDYHGVRIA